MELWKQESDVISAGRGRGGHGDLGLGAVVRRIVGVDRAGAEGGDARGVVRQPLIPPRRPDDGDEREIGIP